MTEPTKIYLEQMDMGVRHHYVPCQCHSLDHSFCFVYFEDLNKETKQFDLPYVFEEMHLEVQLINHKSFWYRAWAALKYMFGHKSRYGHWDGAVISRSEAKKIVDLLNRYINAPVSSTDLGQTTEDSTDGC